MAAFVFTACSDDDDASGKIEPAVLTIGDYSIEEADTLNGATFTFDIPNAKSGATYFLAFGSDPTMKVYTLSKANLVDGKYQTTVYLLDRSVFYSFRVVEMSNNEVTAQSAKLGEYRLGNLYDMSGVSDEDVEISDITLNSARVTFLQPENATGVKFYIFYSTDEDMSDTDTLELARNDEGNYYVDLTGLNQSTTYYFSLASLKDHIYDVTSDVFEFTTLGDPTFMVEVNVQTQNINDFGNETLQTIAAKLLKQYASEEDNYCIVDPNGFNSVVGTFDGITEAVTPEYSGYIDQIVADDMYKEYSYESSAVAIVVTITNVDNPEETKSVYFTGSVNNMPR